MDRSTRPKIVVIGAASSSFPGAPGLADLVGAKQLDGAQVVLVDIDAEGLDIMTRLGRRMTSQCDGRTSVSGTTDRRSRRAGTGRRRFRAHDHRRGRVHDLAAGPGYPRATRLPWALGGHGGPRSRRAGSAPGLIPPLIDVCRDIESVCPSALLINYSNPMAGICRAAKKASKVRVVGLCTAGFLPAQVGRYLDIDPSRVEVMSAGVNHWVWALKVMVDGQDFTEQFKAKMWERANDAWVRSSVELLEIFGVWPFPGANHVAEFFPYFYGPGDDGRSDERYRIRQGHDFNAEMAKSRKQRALLEAQAEGTEPLGHQPPARRCGYWSRSGATAARCTT